MTIRFASQAVRLSRASKPEPNGERPVAALRSDSAIAAGVLSSLDVRAVLRFISVGARSTLLFCFALWTLSCSARVSNRAEEGSGGRSQGTGFAGGSTAKAGSPAGAGGTGTGGSSTVTGGRSGIVLPSAGSGSGGEASCGIQAFDREKKPVELILVLDRSGSMKDPPDGSTVPKWDLTVPAVKSVILATNSAISWGLKLYPESENTVACAPHTIVPTIHVPIVENSAAAVVSAIGQTTPEGDGTPTGDAIRFAHAHLEERSKLNDSPRFILLATDGDPSCPSDPVNYAVTQIGDALRAGFPTFVVGVDTTKESSIERLNRMAEAGGRARPRTDPNPAARHVSFYLTSTQADLDAALRAITTEIASCVFELTPPPPVPDNIALDFAGLRADRDPTRQNGWEYTRDDHTQLQVYGSWCDRIQSEAKNRINIKYGCPNEPIPIPR